MNSLIRTRLKLGCRSKKKLALQHQLTETYLPHLKSSKCHKSKFVFDKIFIYCRAALVTL